MREARKISKGIFDFLKNIVVLLLGTSKSIVLVQASMVNRRKVSKKRMA